MIRSLNGNLNFHQIISIIQTDGFLFFDHSLRALPIGVIQLKKRSYRSRGQGFVGGKIFGYKILIICSFDGQASRTPADANMVVVQSFSVILMLADPFLFTGFVPFVDDGITNFF